MYNNSILVLKQLFWKLYFDYILISTRPELLYYNAYCTNKIWTIYS